MEKGKLANMDITAYSAMQYNRKIRMFNMLSIRYNTSTNTQKKAVTIANCTGEYIKSLEELTNRKIIVFLIQKLFR